MTNPAQAPVFDLENFLRFKESNNYVHTMVLEAGVYVDAYMKEVQALFNNDTDESSAQLAAVYAICHSTLRYDLETMRDMFLAAERTAKDSPGASGLVAPGILDAIYVQVKLIKNRVLRLAEDLGIKEKVLVTVAEDNQEAVFQASKQASQSKPVGSPIILDGVN